MARQSKAEKQLDKDIELAWYKMATDVQVSVMDIPNIFREARVAVRAGRTLEGVMAEIIARYRKN